MNIKKTIKKLVGYVEVLLKIYIRIFFIVILLTISFTFINYTKMWLIEKVTLTLSIMYFIFIPLIDKIRYRYYDE